MTPIARRTLMALGMAAALLLMSCTAPPDGEAAPAPIETVKAVVADVAVVVDESKTELQIAEGVVTVVAPFLPPPWNAVMLGAASLIPAIGGILHGLKKGREARASESTAHAVIKAINTEKKRGGGSVNFNDAKVAENLDVLMGDSGKTMVDDAQRNKG